MQCKFRLPFFFFLVLKFLSPESFYFLFGQASSFIFDGNRKQDHYTRWCFIIYVSSINILEKECETTDKHAYTNQEFSRASLGWDIHCLSPRVTSLEFIQLFLLVMHSHNLEILITPHMVIKLTEDMHLSAAQKVYSCLRACVGDTDNAKLRVL